tara:strand:- start:160 stop:348 length:189 start_codon:yes stop_codon:yes gene_type:complete
LFLTKYHEDFLFEMVYILLAKVKSILLTVSGISLALVVIAIELCNYLLCETLQEKLLDEYYL